MRSWKLAFPVLVSPVLLSIVLAVPRVPAIPPAARQVPEPPSASIEAMRKLDRWIGEWSGKGWTISREGRRIEFELSETVQSKVGGTVHLVEGRGVGRTAAGEELVVHDGIAVVSFDAATGRYRWNGHERGFGAMDAEPVLVDGGFAWTFRVPETTLRFTILVDGETWRETGEASADGKAWSTFLETTLRRKR